MPVPRRLAPFCAAALLGIFALASGPRKEKPAPVEEQTVSIEPAAAQAPPPEEIFAAVPQTAAAPSADIALLTQEVRDDWLRAAARAKDRADVEMLLKTALSEQARIDAADFATQGGNPDWKIVDLILSSGISGDALDGLLLWRAVKTGEAEAARMLLQHGADPLRGEGRYFLEAVNRQDWAMVEALKSQGASFENIETDSRTMRKIIAAASDVYRSSGLSASL